MRNNNHTGPIKGLHFNPKQPNLLASGGPNGEVFIWDLNNPTKPYSPGARSSKLDEITSLSWNGEVAHILATSSSSGYTVVWDLKNKKELTALAYGGGTATSGGAPNGMGGAFGAGARRGMSAVCWHPEQVSSSHAV
jgi:protein transport protein SEC31